MTNHDNPTHKVAAPGTASGGHSRVMLTPDALQIADLRVTDPDVLAGLRRHTDAHGQDPAALIAYVTTALGVGVRALGVVESSLNLAALDRTVSDLGDRVATTTDQALERLAGAVAAATAPGTGTIPRTVETTLHTLTAQISDLVAGQDAPVRAAVTESVRAVTEQALAEVQRAVGAQADAVRRVLATDAPGSPLHDLKTGLVEGLNASHRQLAGQLAELRTALEVDKASRAATAKSPQHGLDSEAATLTALERLAHTAGDQLEPTGTVPGLVQRCLKGDAVITLAPPPGHTGEPVLLVVEVKDRERAQSLGAWSKLLAESRENRGAVAALGIVRTTDQMPGQRRLHVLDPSTYLLAYDPACDDHDLLLAAYHLLRARAWATALDRPDTGSDIDLAALRSSLAELTQALTGFDTLTRHHTAARRSIDAAEKATATLRTDLHARVGATRAHLQPGGTQSQAA